VGELQFEVFKYRLKGEYGADIRIQHLPYQLARWVKSAAPFDTGKLSNLSCLGVFDRDDRAVVLCEHEYALNWLERTYTDLVFSVTP